MLKDTIVPMDSSIWKFINKKTLDVIRVVDSASAKNLKKLIGPAASHWVVLTENLNFHLPQKENSNTHTAKEQVPSNRERRKFKRHKSRFRIILVGAGKSLRTYSADISLGGMRLGIHAPKEMVNQVCRLFIARSESGENIELKCRIILGEKGNAGLEFVSVATETQVQLEKWIKESESLNEMANGPASATKDFSQGALPTRPFGLKSGTNPKVAGRKG